MVADTSLKHLQGSGAQFVETTDPQKRYRRPVRRNSGSAMESAHVKNCVGRCSQSLRHDNYGECVVAMDVLPIKGAAQVKFKVFDGTERILSMPMLVANGNRVDFRGEDAMLITAEKERPRR